MYKWSKEYLRPLKVRLNLISFFTTDTTDDISTRGHILRLPFFAKLSFLTSSRQKSKKKIISRKGDPVSPRRGGGFSQNRDPVFRMGDPISHMEDPGSCKEGPGFQERGPFFDVTIIWMTFFGNWVPLSANLVSISGNRVLLSENWVSHLRNSVPFF